MSTVLVIVLVGYTGAYAAARGAGTLYAFEFSGIQNAVAIGDPLRADGEWVVFSPGDPRTEAVFRPCIAIEEWWRNG